jgi:UDP-2-acetamido-2-deoxy-ribo-hexuluronate aminotransferase
MTEIKFIPTERLYQDIGATMMPRLERLYSGAIQGEGSGHCGSRHFADQYTQRCEAHINEITGRRHTFLTTSGTASIQLMLMAIGVGPGDEVICTNYSCPATVMPIRLLGARPIFVDLDPYGQQDLAQVASRVTPRTRAVMVTDLYGDCSDYDQLQSIDLPVLNDSAQSLMTLYRGRQTASIGDMSIQSFSTNKNCPIFGTYGAISTDDDGLAERIQVMRKNGYGNREVGTAIHHIGINAHPQEDKAVQVLCSLERLAGWQLRRAEIAQRLTERLRSAGVQIRPSPSYSETNHHKFSIFVRDKRQFRDLMTQRGVETQLHYTYNFARTRVLSDNTEQHMPMTEFYARHAISIPSNPWLTDQEVDQVAEAVKSCVTDKDLETRIPVL